LNFNISLLGTLNDIESIIFVEIYLLISQLNQQTILFVSFIIILLRQKLKTKSTVKCFFYFTPEWAFKCRDSWFYCVIFFIFLCHKNKSIGKCISIPVWLLKQSRTNRKYYFSFDNKNIIRLFRIKTFLNRSTKNIQYLMTTFWYTDGLYLELVQKYHTKNVLMKRWSLTYGESFLTEYFSILFWNKYISFYQILNFFSVLLQL